MCKAISKNSLAGKPGRRAILSFVASLGLAFCPLTQANQIVTASVTLAWNPSSSAGVAGYRLQSSADGITYNNPVDAGTNTTWTVTGLQGGSTNYFEVAAYDTNNNQSPPSSPVEYVVPGTNSTVAVQANPANAGSVTGGGSFATGSSVTVTATANSGYTFSNWTANGTVQSARPATASRSPQTPLWSPTSRPSRPPTRSRCRPIQPMPAASPAAAPSPQAVR